MNKFCMFFAVLGISSITINAQTTVTRAITNFNGYWSSEATAVNPVLPDNSHMLLGFQYGSVIYSTGVGDSVLTAHNVNFQPANFQAFQLAASTIHTGSATVIGVGYQYGGPGNVDPFPVNSDLPAYLSDGVHGLDLGTAIFNAAPNNLLYNINATNDSAIGDNTPDILVTQVGEPPASNTLDSFRFIDVNGVTVGHAVAVSVAGLAIIGNGSWKFYNTGSPMTYNSGLQGNRPLRMIAFDFADFGITTANIGTVRNFVHKLSGQSDQAFVAYNSTSFSPGTGVTLPVTWSAFQAEKAGHTAKLNWTIVAQEDFSSFVIERSTDGSNFNAIGEVAFRKGAGNYQFTDLNPVAGANMYRLRVVDVNQHATFSSVQKLDFGGADEIVVYPNPCQDFITLSSLIAGDDIKLSNASGIAMPVRRQGQSTVNMIGLPAGIYTLSIYRGGQKLHTALVIKK